MELEVTLCAYEVAPGKACGHGLGLHSVLGVCHACPDTQAAEHSFTSGRQCQTCAGYGDLEVDEIGPGVTPCPRCIGGVEPIKGGE